MAGIYKKRVLFVMGRRKTAAVVCVLIAAFCACCLFYAGIQKEKKMTVDETVQLLMEYIYDEDYLSVCTRYDSKEDGPLLRTYNSEWVKCPIYEFDLPLSLPDEECPARRQIFCIGETKNGEYLVLGVFSWGYYAHGEEREYMRPQFDSRYAVNRITGEIIPERYRSDFLWLYNEAYDEIIKPDALVYKEFYE